MARMVHVYEEMGFKELKKIIMQVFNIDEFGFIYWPSTSFELDTCINMPPVLLTSDGAVMIEKMPAVNDTEGVDYSRMGFVPPTTLRGMWD
ncbi:hypothetical protein HID58_055423, partial [Brassica napus]